MPKTTWRKLLDKLTGQNRDSDYKIVGSTAILPSGEIVWADDLDWLDMEFSPDDKYAPDDYITPRSAAYIAFWIWTEKMVYFPIGGGKEPVYLSYARRNPHPSYALIASIRKEDRHDIQDPIDG